MTEATKRYIPFICAVVLGLIAVSPYVMHTFHPSYEGLTVIRDKDFGNYYSRFERALRGFGAEANNAITPVGSHIDGMQVAGPERFVGFLLGWTREPLASLGFRASFPSAPTISVILIPIFLTALFLLFVYFFKLLEFTRWWALWMTIVYFVITFHIVSRAVHLGWSYIPIVGALIAFMAFYKKSSLRNAIITGILLGILPYVYFWGFTYVWACVACFAAYEIFANGLKNSLQATSYKLQATIVIALTIAISIPFFLHTYELAQNPFYSQIEIRGSFLYTRGVESIPRSVLLALQTLLMLTLWRRFKNKFSYIAVISMLTGILIAMHQNFVHGKILMFSSHYYPFLLLSTLIAGSWVIANKTPLLRKFLIAVISLVFLGAGFVDYIDGHRFFVPREENFRDQHLTAPISHLRDNGSNDVILTDAHTGRVLTSWTEDGIVYTTHARFLLISDEEIAERYCVSELFTDGPPDSHRTIYIEYNDVLDSPEMRAKEERLVLEACARVQSDPESYLKKYGVTHVLWNQFERPDWNIFQYDLPLKVVDSKDDWLLLKLSS